MKAIVKMNGIRIHKSPMSLKAAVMKAFRMEEAFRLEGYGNTQIKVEVTED